MGHSFPKALLTSLAGYGNAFQPVAVLPEQMRWQVPDGPHLHEGASDLIILWTVGYPSLDLFSYTL